MTGGLATARTEGTPQGGRRSPLLSNSVLDDRDKERERRGQAYCRYADDCNSYVRSERAGHRVMAALMRYLAERLKLTVNHAESAATPVKPHVPGLQRNGSSRATPQGRAQAWPGWTSSGGYAGRAAANPWRTASRRSSLC